ncbi:hypothetical protein AVEN_251801-1, partial [Araneus ventricosus]
MIVLSRVLPNGFSSNFRDRSDLVVRHRLQCRRVPGLKPDSTEDPA